MVAKRKSAALPECLEPVGEHLFAFHDANIFQIKQERDNSYEYQIDLRYRDKHPRPQKPKSRFKVITFELEQRNNYGEPHTFTFSCPFCPHREDYQGHKYPASAREHLENIHQGNLVFSKDSELMLVFPLTKDRGEDKAAQ